MTLYAVTYVEVGAGAAARGAVLVREHGDASRRAAGALRVEVLQRIDRPNQFAMLLAWRDQHALEAHQAAGTTRAFDDALRPWLVSPNDERLHQGLSVAVAPASPPGAVYVVTHVDIVPPRKEDGIAALARLAEESRRDSGLVRFDVVQQTGRPNHFTVVEVWRDRQAFDVHGVAAHARRFRAELAPMTGALYDERLYRALD